MSEGRYVIFIGKTPGKKIYQTAGSAAGTAVTAPD